MHFTRKQLRTLLAPFETERPPEELPILEPYGQDLSKVTLLSVLTSESGIVNLAAIPRNGGDREELELVRRRITTLTGTNDEQIQPSNFRKVMRNAPVDLVAYDEETDTVGLTERGEASLALGGLLLRDISIKRKQKIRDWVGGRHIPGKEKVSTRATPQLNRVHILGSLIPEGAQLSMLQLAEASDGNLAYRNGLGLANRMAIAGVLTKVPVPRSSKVTWQITPSRRDAAKAFLETIESFDPTDRSQVDAGLEVIDRILTSSNGDIARVLYVRGLLSIGFESRPEPASLNERVAALFKELPRGTELSAPQIGRYLGENLTAQRMHRQLGRPGSKFPIECVTKPYFTTVRHTFRPRKLDYSQS